MIIRPHILPNHPVFSWSIVFGPKYIILVEMNILKTLQRLEADTEKGSGK